MNEQVYKAVLEFTKKELLKSQQAAKAPTTASEIHKLLVESMLASQPKSTSMTLTEPPKPHSLPRLTSKLYNTPHLIDQSSLSSIISYLDMRNAGELKIDSASVQAPDKPLPYNSSTRTGIIAIEGPLTYKATGFEALCGGASYQSITEQFNAMVSAGAKTIVLDVDSGGGEAYGMMELGRYMRSTANKRGIRIISYVDGLAASAAYGLACIADEVIANPAAEVGSIGVVVKLRNTNKAMQQMGIEDTYVYAGGSKVPFNSDGRFSESFLSDLQHKVNALYSEFTSYVASMRRIPAQAVVATEAKTFLATDALRLKLIDRMMTHEQFHSYLNKK